MTIPSTTNAVDKIKEDFVTRIKQQLLINADAQSNIPDVLKGDKKFLRDLQQRLKDKGWDTDINGDVFLVNHPDLN